MSYELDNETSELNEIKAKAKELEDQLFDLVTIGTENDGPPVTPTIGKVRERDNTLGGTLGRTELGNIENTINIDFTEYDPRRIFGNVIGNLDLTFTKPVPIPLSLALRLYIKTDNPIITIDGTPVSGAGSDPALSTVIDDFLDIQLESSDGNMINIISVKKNDETAADIIPTFPRDFETINHTNVSVGLRWNTPGIGSLPILYDVSYSQSPAENPDGSPANPIETFSDIDATEFTVSGLTPATTYYFWINAKNESGESGFIGPVQTNTDASYNAGNVNFSVSAIDFRTVRASWTQPDGKQLRFTLIRNLGSGVLETVVNNDVPAQNQTNSYDDEKLDPNTNYSYIFEVRNEFGILISTLTTSATTPDLPDPVFSLLAQGRKIRITVNMIAGINLCDIEWDISNTFTERVARRTISKTVSTETFEQIIEFTPDLIQTTTYYVRARFRKNENIGPFSDAQSAFTGTLLTPSQPSLSVSSPSTGQVRIRVRFNDSPTRNESAIISFRDQASVGPYDEFDGNILSRDFPPSDDLDSREDRIEVIRGGFTPGDQLTFRAVASNLTGTSPADTDNVTVDS